MADFDHPQSVTFWESRWDVGIVIVDMNGKAHTYIASADNFFTDGSGIFFGTEAEYKEKEEGAF